MEETGDVEVCKSWFQQEIHNLLIDVDCWR